MKRVITEKRMREEDPDVTFLTSEVLTDLGVVKKPHLDQEVEPDTSDDIESQDISYSPLELFIIDNVELFTQLINDSMNERLAQYLLANTISFDYMKQLCGALQDLSRDPKEIRFTQDRHNPHTGQTDISIDEDDLLALLNDPHTAQGQQLVNLIWEGWSSWRLPKISHLFRLSTQEPDDQLIKALTWLEKNRDFIKRCMNKDHDLLAWTMSSDAKAHRATLKTFTAQFFAVLSAPDRPPLIDVRKLWYAIPSNEVSAADHEYNAGTLCSFSWQDLLRSKYLASYQSAYPNSLVCFLDALNGIDRGERNEHILDVDGDVLMWLQLGHCENSVIAETIMSHAEKIDEVIQAYEQYQKQKSQRVSSFANLRANLFGEKDMDGVDGLINNPASLVVDLQDEERNKSVVRGPTI